MHSRKELLNWGLKTGTEVRQSYARWLHDGFFDRYLSGQHILDIGYRGYDESARAITPWAKGIDLDYPGYDGKNLPFPDKSQDTVFCSHVLEHIEDYRSAIIEWFRVLRFGGHLIIIVPHQFLYERKLSPPSIWNQDHKRFYTAGSLLKEIEEAINPALYRIRLTEDNDRNFDYSIPSTEHAGGCYEIIVVLQKILPPTYIFEFQKKARGRVHKLIVRVFSKLLKKEEIPVADQSEIWNNYQ
ncbi:putative SAM-dependent methyltransferase [Sphingobium sp. B11D3B]|uniref:class I SAM-dependent methyltransferase n=1 Tax=Sphingobium sp. B11D3B TaxID=2940575 RepID=UPI002225DD07|nr:methyltransferase domain-containing protein [Sphingobium sp. B11D3B]MCW2387636.1 putative SAM-dependent methyltransferase [Sphingobium sp. B11D3B]